MEITAIPILGQFIVILINELLRLTLDRISVKTDIAGDLLKYVLGILGDLIAKIWLAIKNFFSFEIPSIPDINWDFNLSEINISKLFSDITLKSFTNENIGFGLFSLAGIFVVIILITRFSRLLLPIYPITKWGFRAKLLYADDNGEKRIFRNKHYKVSVNPDFIYRLADSRLAYIEYKSRSYMMDSDITQLEIGILALRETYNVTRGGIALLNGEIHWIKSAREGSAKLFNKNKDIIEQVLNIKQGEWVPPAKKAICKKCPMKEKCWK